MCIYVHKKEEKKKSSTLMILLVHMGRGEKKKSYWKQKSDVEICAPTHPNTVPVTPVLLLLTLHSEPRKHVTMRNGRNNNNIKWVHASLRAIIPTIYIIRKEWVCTSTWASVQLDWVWFSGITIKYDMVWISLRWIRCNEFFVAILQYEWTSYI